MSNGPGVILNARCLPYPRRFGLSVAAYDSDGVLVRVCHHTYAEFLAGDVMHAGPPVAFGEVGVADVALVHPSRVA